MRATHGDGDKDGQEVTAKFERSLFSVVCFPPCRALSEMSDERREPTPSFQIEISGCKRKRKYVGFRGKDWAKRLEDWKGRALRK
jgi:hypothetical protein